MVIRTPVMSGSRPRNSVQSTKAGVLLGRVGKGRGPIQVLTAADLVQQLKLAGGGTIGGGGPGATGANPTAVAGPVAVNGTAKTFTRSDGAPAVQVATTAQKGLVQPDGTTITISAGVISAAAAGGGPPTTDYWDIVHAGDATFAIGPDWLSLQMGAGISGVSWAMIRGKESKSAGKLYFEMKAGASGNYTVLGFAYAAASLDDWPGDNVNSWGQISNGTVTAGAGGTPTGGSAWATGDVIGFAVDFTGGTITFYKNNSANGSITGITFSGPIFLCAATDGQPSRYFLHTTAANCVYSPPAGYTNWN
jgi:hypothetical protein